MAKYRGNIQQYVIRDGEAYFSYKNGKIEWTSSVDNANRYASAYAAKSHLRSLTELPKDVWYELLQ